MSFHIRAFLLVTRRPICLGGSGVTPSEVRCRSGRMLRHHWRLSVRWKASPAARCHQKFLTSPVGLDLRLPDDVPLRPAFGVQRAVVFLPWFPGCQGVEEEPLVGRVEPDSFAGGELVEATVQKRDEAPVPLRVVPQALRAERLDALLVDDIPERPLGVFQVVEA